MSTGYMYQEYNRWTGDVDIIGVSVLQTLDLGSFCHDLCRYKVWPGVRVGQKVPRCVWGECDFHVNWLHVSRIQPTHWRLNDDFDINQRRRRLTRNILIGVCVCVCVCVCVWIVPSGRQVCENWTKLLNLLSLATASVLLSQLLMLRIWNILLQMLFVTSPHGLLSSSGIDWSRSIATISRERSKFVFGAENDRFW